MMKDSMYNYEQIRAEFESLEIPTFPEVNIQWIVPNKFGMGRDNKERYLLFFACSDLEVGSEVVKAAIVSNQSWKNIDGTIVSGFMIGLPKDDAFLIAATSIVIELIRIDVKSRELSVVFTEIESYIELVLRRLILTPTSIVGLIGELIVVEAILRTLILEKKQSPLDVLKYWKGHSPAARDFDFGTLEFEVKTTTKDTSTHMIDNINQVQSQNKLYLISIGLTLAETDTLLSVKSLVDSIMKLLSGSKAAQDQFLICVSKYSKEASYNHETMSDWGPYQKSYKKTFEIRIYDIQDDNIKVIRSSDLKDLMVIDNHHITYEVCLPVKVKESIENPQSFKELSSILKQYVS